MRGSIRLSVRNGVLMLLAASASCFAQNSPAPLGDRPPQKTGYIPNLQFTSAPETVWQFEPPDDERGKRPGVSDVATSGGMLFFGDDRGVVRAVTALNGHLIWKYEHGERVFFPPTCDGQRLFFTTRKGITALRSASGIFMWHRPVSHSVGRCVAWKKNNTVYFSDSDGVLYALDAETGDELWKASLMDDAPADPPGFDGGQARFQGTAARPSGIATDGKAVYQSVFDQCRVVAFSCVTGDRIATYQTKGWVFADPAVDDDRLFVGSQDKHLHCFDKVSGKKLWTFATEARIESCPGVTDDYVVIPSCDGSVYCCDKNTGVLIWKTATDHPGAIYSAPIVTQDSVYFAAGEGTVYGLSIETGEVRWRHRPSATSDLYSSLATDGTRLFIKCRPKDEQTGINAIFAIGPGK